MARTLERALSEAPALQRHGVSGAGRSQPNIGPILCRCLLDVVEAGRRDELPKEDEERHLTSTETQFEGAETCAVKTRSCTHGISRCTGLSSHGESATWSQLEA